MHRLCSLLLMAALGSSVAACSLKTGEPTQSASGNAGELQVALLAANGIDVTEVAYSIQVPGQPALQGTLPVAEDGTVGGTVADVPAAEGVLVTLTASTKNGGVCSGEGTVTVTAGQTTSVAIVLQCRLPDGTPITSGSIEITGTFNICPQLLDAAANPTSTETTSALTSNATDLNSDTLTYAWTATKGSFADAAAANTTYTCTDAGAQTLTVTVDDGKGCTHSKTVAVTCTAVAPPAAVCGNNTKEAGEECDDGNTVDGDGCSATCTTEVAPPAAVCGNNTKETGEECDDGNTVDGDGCSATCTTEVAPPAPACGDNQVDPGEQCDDGNTADGDGCSATCTTEAEVPTCEQPRPNANACTECGCAKCEKETTACDHATGNAAEGSAAGQPKAKLCSAVVKCGQVNNCRGSACFCGTASLVDCLLGKADGPCQAEISAAAETSDLSVISDRQTSLSYAVGLANAVSTCSVNSCSAECGTAAASGG